MKVKIKNVIQEFISSLDGRLIGLYEVEITETESNNGKKFVVVNGDFFGVLSHMSQHSEFSRVTTIFRDAICLALKERGC